MGGGLEVHALGGDGGGEFLDLDGEFEELFVGERVWLLGVEAMEFACQLSEFHSFNVANNCSYNNQISRRMKDNSIEWDC